MQILASSTSAANKDMDKSGYNYLIELKTLWEEEKLLVTSNFSFSHNVFKSFLVLMRQNEYLWSKELTLHITTQHKPQKKKKKNHKKSLWGKKENC